MKKLLAVLLFLPAMAWGQTYPSPTFSNLTLQNPLSPANGGTGATGSTGSGNVVLATSPALVTPSLGTPSFITLTNATGLPVTTGISGLGTGVAAGLANGATGSGSMVLATSPTLVTPNLGTPSAATLSNATGLPISTGVSGLGTGVATALGSAVTGSGGAVLATSPTLVTPNIGTPSAGVLTHATGLPLSTGISGFGTGVAAGLANAVTGSGSPVLATSPSIASPTITGSFTATGLITNASLASTAANTLLGNSTASSASPSSLVVPSCNGAGNALAWTSGTGFSCTSGYAAPSINYAAGLNTLSGIALPISLLGEAPGTFYISGGGLQVTDNSSHAGTGHVAYSITSSPVGTGSIGPTNADFGLALSVRKQNYATTTQGGELDGLYSIVRQGGSNSDAAGILIDVANYGTGGNIAYEGVTSQITSGTVVQQVDVQSGAVDTRNNLYYGHVANKIVGAGTGTAFIAQNYDTSGGTGKWSNLLTFSGGGNTMFSMPIASNDVVSMKMFDASANSKTIGVNLNSLYVQNSAGTTQIFNLDDSGDLTIGGTFSTNAVSTVGLTATGTITPSTTSGIVGTTVANNANSGSVGEVISVDVPSGSAISLTTGASANVTSLTLTPGDWDCRGQAVFVSTSSTSLTLIRAGMNTTSLTLPLAEQGGFHAINTTFLTSATQTNALPIGTYRYNVSSNTTLYLVAQASFTASTQTAYGSLACRRMR